MQQDINISVGSLLRFVRRGLLPALLAAVLLGYGVFRYTNAQPRVYRAEATVVAAETNPDVSRFGVSPVVAPPLDVTAYMVAARADTVLDQAVATINAAAGGATLDARQLRSVLSVTTQDTRTSSLLSIAVEGQSPERVALMSNAVASALVAWDKQRATASMQQIVTSLQQQVDSLAEQIRSIQALDDPARQSEVDGLITLRAQQQQSLSVARALTASTIGRLDVLQRASVPVSPIAPRPLFSAVLASALGIAISYGVFLLLMALDTRVRDPERLAAVTGLSILAEFPRLPKGMRRLPRESASYLRTRLQFATADANPKIIAITSPRDGDGKSSVALSLAEGFARNDYRTLLVDADLRRPVMHAVYNISRVQRGSLVDYLEDPDGPFQPARVLMGAKKQLHVVPSYQDSSQAGELLARGFEACLARWARDYDVIIVDTPPLLAVADALTLAPFCTGAVLVSNVLRADRRQVRLAQEYLERVGARVLGAVATMVPDARRSRPEAGYGYAVDNDEDFEGPTARPNAVRATVRQRPRRS